MREPIENEYFNWLCAKVLDFGAHTYIDLLIILHRTEFIWMMHADSHRASEGIDLRNDYIREANPEPDQLWEEQPCSVLEFLIAFAKRCAFQTDMPLKHWFWEFMNNLKLDDYRQVSEQDVCEIDNILNVFIWRQYDSRGFGGIFPMSKTQNDQRNKEIWYQFPEYLEDKGLL